MKCIQIVFNDGEKWLIPLKLVVGHRAKYYAKDKREYDEEFVNGMTDIENTYPIGIEWLKNNMDFHEFKDNMKIIKTKPENKDWTNADKEIINVNQESEQDSPNPATQDFD